MLQKIINVHARQLMDGHIGIYFERWLMAEVKDVYAATNDCFTNTFQNELKRIRRDDEAEVLRGEPENEEETGEYSLLCFIYH